MTTVVTVAGMFGAFTPRLTERLMASWFKQQLTNGKTPPSTLGSFDQISNVLSVKYANYLPWGQKVGARNLNTTLINLTGQGKVIVLGHSMGAYSIWTWLREYAPGSSFDTSQVLFIMTGAQMNMKTASHITGSRYQVLDVTAQYDQFADFPNVTSSQYYNEAQRICVTANIHQRGYPAINLNSTPDKSNTIGSARYWFYKSTVATLVSAANLDTAYNRSNYLGS